LIVVGRDDSSIRPVHNYEPHFPVREEFVGSSYLERYKILCQKLILERHYTSTALLWTSDASTYGDISSDISIYGFLNSLSCYLQGVKNEYK
jgi:type II restriction enzyme